MSNIIRRLSRGSSSKSLRSNDSSASSSAKGVVKGLIGFGWVKSDIGDQEWLQETLNWWLFKGGCEPDSELMII